MSMVDPDGKPYAGCPLHILRRQLARAKEMGYTMDVLSLIHIFCEIFSVCNGLLEQER